jgi:hypothetical protein
MKKKTIKVTCKGSASVPIETLLNFQGNLKSFDKSALEKLKRSLIKHGFSFPVFVWGNEILDGHQRIFAAKRLVEDGYSIGKIPVVEIEAKDKKEAGEKLLVLNSTYGKKTNDGMLSFLDDFEIIPDLDILEIPSIDFDKILDADAVTELFDSDDKFEDANQNKRDLGNKQYQIKPVLYTTDIDIFERAILATGEQRYASGLIKICEFYLENKNV